MADSMEVPDQNEAPLVQQRWVRKGTRYGKDQ